MKFSHQVKGGRHTLSIVGGIGCYVLAALGLILIYGANVEYESGFYAVVVVTIALGSIFLWYGLIPVQLILTNNHLILRRGYQILQKMHLLEIYQIRMVAQIIQTRQGEKKRPVIVIEGEISQPLTLEICSSRQPESGLRLPLKESECNTQAVFQDLLPELPVRVLVDPAVKAFARSGQIPDISTLPVIS